MLSKLRALLTDSMIYGISGSLSRLVGLLLLPFLTDYLSPADMGVVFMLSIIGMLFVPLANLGMSNAIFRRFNRTKDIAMRQRVFSTGLTSIACSTLLLLAVSYTFAGTISEIMIGDPWGKNLVRLTLLGAAASSVSAAFQVALRATRRVKIAASINVFKVALSATSTLAFVIIFNMGVLGAVLGTLVGEVAGGASQLLFTAREFRGRFEWELWKDMFAYAFPFAPHQIQGVAIELFGVYVVREMLGLEAAGLYSIAARFASPVSLVVNSVQTSWVPYKFQIHAEDAKAEEFFQSAFVFYIAGLSYLWVGASLWGPEVVKLMTTPPFHPAALIVWATTLMPVARGIYFMAGTGLELTKNTWTMPLVSLSGLIVVVGSAFLFVEPLGALGAALSTSLGWFVMACVIGYLSNRVFPIAYDWLTIGLFAAMASLFVLFGFGLEQLPWVIRLIGLVASTLLYPVLSFGLLLRSRDERHRMLILAERFRKFVGRPPAAPKPAEDAPYDHAGASLAEAVPRVSGNEGSNE